VDLAQNYAAMRLQVAMSVKILHPGKLSLYLTLSLADLFLTYRLLQEGGGRVYEGNPIANAWLVAYGWRGLVMFKLLAMLLVGCMAAYVSLYHPQKGGHILQFACCALGLVVIYSCSLMRVSDSSPEKIEELEQQQIEQAMAAHREYYTLFHKLLGELANERCTLNDAVDKLQQCKKIRAGGYGKLLRERYPELSVRDCLAMELIRGVTSWLRDEPTKAENAASWLLKDNATRSAPFAPALATIILTSREKK